MAVKCKVDVDVDMLNAVKINMLADVSSVSPSSEQRGRQTDVNLTIAFQRQYQHHTRPGARVS